MESVSLRNLLIAFAAGLVMGLVGMWYVSGKQYASLKTFADSTRAADSTQVAQVHHYSDSLEMEVAQLSARKQKIITKVVADTSGIAAAESLIVAASTSRDNIDAQREEIAVLKSVNKSLFAALAISDTMFAREKQRGDSLQHTLDSVNQSVQQLTERINKLHGMPTWFKVSVEIVKIGGATYAGFQFGKRH